MRGFTMSQTLNTLQFLNQQILIINGSLRMDMKNLSVEQDFLVIQKPLSRSLSLGLQSSALGLILLN
jgi:hypothetical protein